MAQYMLATYAVETDETDEPPEASAPPSTEQMKAMMSRIIELEAEMDAAGTFVFGGHLHGPDAATVVHPGDAGIVMTDGPFAEAKEHVAGFYIINADDLDVALEWARRVAECVGRPIEVQPFAGTGRVADQIPDR